MLLLRWAVANCEPGVNCGLHVHDSEEVFYILRGKGKGLLVMKNLILKRA